MAFFNTFYEEKFMITVKDFRTTEKYKNTNASNHLAQKPTAEETIEHKTNRVLSILKTEGIEVTPQIRTLVWTQVKAKDDTHRIKKYLQEFRKYNLQPLKNDPPKIKVSERKDGEYSVQNGTVVTRGIHLVPCKAFEVLFPNAAWDRAFFKKQKWVVVITKKRMLEMREIDAHDLVNNVCKLAIEKLTSEEIKCFAFETAESVF